MRNFLMTFGFTVLLSGTVLLGQTRTTEAATIPFSFEAGGKVLPAGTYLATVVSPVGMIQLEDRATLRSVMVPALVPKGGQVKQSKIGFRCYGGHCFLSEVWYAGQANGHSVMVGKREKELIANSGQPKLVYLAAR